VNRRELVIASAAASIAGGATAGSRYPTVPELEAALTLTPGATLPKQVNTREGLFNVRYVRAVEKAGGRVLVELQLVRG
jgi:hypothetical protein